MADAHAQGCPTPATTAFIVTADEDAEQWWPGREFLGCISLDGGLGVVVEEKCMFPSLTSNCHLAFPLVINADNKP